MSEMESLVLLNQNRTDHRNSIFIKNEPKWTVLQTKRSCAKVLGMFLFTLERTERSWKVSLQLENSG